MQQITTITIDDLVKMSEKMYGNLVKGVVDIEKSILVLDAEMHVDIEQYLLEQGSKQQDLWGINLYPAKYKNDDFVEFDSMINIRPRQNNMSRGVDDTATQIRIREIINQKVQ